MDFASVACVIFLAERACCIALPNPNPTFLSILRPEEKKPEEKKTQHH